MIVSLLLGVFLLASAGSEPTIAESSPVAAPSKSPRLAPFKERRAAAETVKVETSILGLELDSTLEQAHEKLDSLGDSARPPLEAAAEAEGDEKERKVLWHLAKSDFSSVLAKTDEKGRIVYLTGFIRQGKEIPFEQIGQTAKAPILTDRTVAWDVIRPQRPLIRVVARGEKRKASSITIFVVKRPVRK